MDSAHPAREANGNGARPAQIREELQRILHSSAFRTSRRCQQFLTYVVEHALEGDRSVLKERAIGTAAFGRPPAYDTGEDAIVRGTANEVRRRLAQYHLENPESGCRIELPVGTYVPVFHFKDEPQEPEPPAAPEGQPAPEKTGRQPFPAWPRMVAAAVAVTALALWLIPFRRLALTPFGQFWQPAIDSPGAALVCLGHPTVFPVMEQLQNE